MILDSLKAFFIPDLDVIKGHINNMSSKIETAFGLDTSQLDFLTEGVQEAEIGDFTCDLPIGDNIVTVTLLDARFLRMAVEKFRPILRGMLVLTLLFFNYKQALSFIGQKATGD